ncbi:amidohydrolase family protein, partial [Streptomyces sp. PGLac3x]
MTTATPLRITGARIVDGTGVAPVTDGVVCADADGVLRYVGPAAGAPAAAPPPRDVALGRP